jgi:hypothetical protein
MHLSVSPFANTESGIAIFLKKISQKLKKIVRRTGNDNDSIGSA